jgi:type III secretory pathway component EscR
MKQQITRLSPHQNGKVAAVLAAVVSLIVLVPVFLLASLAGAGTQGMPLWAIFILPVIYLIVGYIATVIGCALYNVITPMTGGIEYDSSPATA